MSHYSRMLILLLAGFFFIVPLLSKPLLANHWSHANHARNMGRHFHHGLDSDDPFDPCAE